MGKTICDDCIHKEEDLPLMWCKCKLFGETVKLTCNRYDRYAWEACNGFFEKDEGAE